MDALNLYVTVGAVVIGVLSGATSFLNRKRYQDLVATLQAESNSVRNRNHDLTDENTDLRSQIAACKARDEEKERLIDNYKKQPNLAGLTRLISNNHKEVMAAITGKK